MFRPVFGHDAPMPLDEFVDAVDYVGKQYWMAYEALKYPAVQVAEVEHFHWSPDAFHAMKRKMYSGYVDKLAVKHLSPQDYLAWKSSR